MFKRKMKIRPMALGVLGILSIGSLLLTGCGREKESDPASEKVLRISITPMPTATPIPELLNPDAITTNGSLTMTNDYILENTIYEQSQETEKTIRPASRMVLDAEADSEADIYENREEGTGDE